MDKRIHKSCFPLGSHALIKNEYDEYTEVAGKHSPEKGTDQFLIPHAVQERNYADINI